MSLNTAAAAGASPLSSARSFRSTAQLPRSNCLQLALRGLREIFGCQFGGESSRTLAVLGFFAAAGRAATVLPELTEREILSLVAQSRSNLEIAERLSLSPKTVRNHVSNILAKLQVTDRTQAALRAREAGL